ncbi:WXG100 family type VII secretion target [Cellulosimicrobium sp. 22601]|uniref:WXG100 family type VII secretion target n=1 Tax=unclassified Cellulosimicrobium TaxID=2624466 RepID=UPI003F869128
MSGFWGSSPAELRNLAARATDARGLLEDARHVLDTAVRATSWSGPDGDAFRTSWAEELAPRLSAAALVVDHLSTTLRHNAAQQESSSAPTGPSDGWALPSILRVGFASPFELEVCAPFDPDKGPSPQPLARPDLDDIVALPAPVPDGIGPVRSLPDRAPVPPDLDGIQSLPARVPPGSIPSLPDHAPLDLDDIQALPAHLDPPDGASERFSE